MEYFLSPVPKNFVEETFCVSESDGLRKILGIREGAGITIFRQNCFCLTVPNPFLAETFCVSESFGYRKGLCLRGDYTPFSLEFLMPQSTEKLRRGTHLCFTKFSVSKRFRNKRGGRNECHNFPSKWFLSHSTKSFPRGNLLCFRKFRLSEMFMPKRGLSSFFYGQFVVSGTEKLRRRTHLCLAEFFASKNFRNKRGGRSECHDFPSKWFLSHSINSFRRRNILCFR